ncbi:ATP-binding protein [Microbacterium profundi]
MDRSRTPNPAACVEDIHYLPGRSLNRDVISRLAACRWLDNGTNLVILGTSSVGKSYLAQALVNSACRHDYTARYYRLDDLANQLAILDASDPARLRFLSELHGCDLLVLDDSCEASHESSYVDRGVMRSSRRVRRVCCLGGGPHFA